MPRHPWTIENELCKLSSQAVESNALYVLGLTDDDSGRCRIEEIMPWERSGAETYSYVFDVCKSKIKQRYILKALVAPTLGTPPAMQVKNWVTRRQRLESFGISTPRLFAAKHGVLLEEFIERDAIEYLRTLAKTDSISPAIQKSLKSICKQVYAAGFNPIGILRNLRTTGVSFVWVDFGSDLGDHHPGASIKLSPARILERELESYVWSAVRKQEQH